MRPSPRREHRKCSPTSGGERSAFLFFNGVLTIFSAFFFLWFLGVLHGVLRRAEGEVAGLSSVALAGGVMFVTLSWAGVAVEVVYPATLARRFLVALPLCCPL